MSATPRILTAWFAVVAAGFGCGWVLRMGHPAQDPAASVIGPAVREPVRKSPPALPPVPRLEEVVAAPASERAGLLARYLSTADVAGMKLLYEQTWATDFRSMIMLRWTAIDPEAAMVAGGGWARQAWSRALAGPTAAAWKRVIRLGACKHGPSDGGRS